MGGSSSGGGGGNNNNRKNKIVNALVPAPIKILKGLKKASKKSKQNVLDYEGQAAGVTPMRAPIRSRDNERDNKPTRARSVKSVKSVEQPKVASQMAAPKPVETPKGPTKTEMIETGSDESISANEEQELLKRKKKGRKATVLTSVTGDTSYVTLSKPTLLGG